MRKTLRLVLLALVSLAVCTASGTPQSAERIAALRARFMAPCCWHESLARHNSPVADELRARIDRAVAAGQSDSEIEAAFVAEYGRRILADPGGTKGTLLTTAPIVVAAVGLIWVAFLLRRWTRPRPATGT